MKYFLAIVAWLACAAQAAALQGDTLAHDPTLWPAEGGVLHVFATGQGIQHLRSADGGMTWRREAPVLAARPAWWDEAVPAHKGLDVWAPKAFAHAGRFWLLYSISTFGKNRSAIGLASSSGPDANDWRDEGLVVQSRAEDDFNAIDPDLLRDRDGRLWLAHGSFWKGIRLTELDARSLRPIGEPRFIARHEPGIEAATLLRRGEWVYLFVSHDLCCRGVDSTYNIRVGRSREVTGPYLDRDGRPLLEGGGTLVEAGSVRWKGPGHQDVVGDFIVRHAYDAQDSGRPHLRLGRLDWSGEGWPRLAAEE